MSERLFALLLRLYPAHFRARFGEESLQLIRDRLRDETGALARLRLLIDLLSDTAVAVPRAHRVAASAVAPATAPINGLPSFSLLEPQSLRPATLVLAGIVGITATGVFAVFLHYAGINHASRLAAIEADAAANRRWTNGGFLGQPAPPPPPPPSYDLLDTPPNTNPPSALQPPDARSSTVPTDSAHPSRPATSLHTPAPSANDAPPGDGQPLTPLVMVPVLGPARGTAPAIPLPAIEKQFGIRPDPASRPSASEPARAVSAPPLAGPRGARSIVVFSPNSERPPCPATLETGSKSSIKPASSAAFAQKSLPCSKSPKSPIGSRSPASAATPK